MAPETVMVFGVVDVSLVARAGVAELLELVVPDDAEVLADVAAGLAGVSETVSAEACEGARARDRPTAGMAARMKPAVRV
ncbi:hypothetical protein LJ112_09880 [Propionibacterium freudenreichii]|uniref:hypothetical protein n=1 Tax=Propionibacterium freudenreichii TaxID=1744 RepID=UPI000762C6D1|nr:hypothetical protein [Propionibacterium freudenreichii]WBF59761.1 hypothetical protein LJ113_00305 [Propionibacterium freudenreichii]WBF63768.1 hypothetical protein LJ112_09880 [Propionibacterium freudenreichii]